MGAVPYIYAEANTQSSTNTSFTNCIETAALVSGTKYLLLSHALTHVSSSSVNYEFQILNDQGSTLTGSLTQKDAHSSSSDRNHCYSFATVFTAASTGTCRMQFRTLDAAKTVSMAHGTLTLIALDDLTEDTDWFFAQNTSATALTTSEQTFASKSLAITASNSGDWLIVGGGSFSIDTTSRNLVSRINATNAAPIGGGVAGTRIAPLYSREGEDTDEITADWVTRAMSLVSGNTSVIDVVAWDDGISLSSNDHVASFVIGLRLESFRNYSAQWDESENTGINSSNWTAMLSGSITPHSTNKVLCIGSAIWDAGTSGEMIAQKFSWEGSDAWPNLSGEWSERAYDDTDEAPFMFVGLVDGTVATASAFSWDGKRSGSSGATEDHSLVLINLDSIASASDGVGKAWQGTDGNLATDSNWTPYGTPTTADRALFSSGSGDATAGTVSCASLHVGESYSGKIGTSGSKITVTATDLISHQRQGQLHISATSTDVYFNNVSRQSGSTTVAGTITNLHVLDGPMTVANSSTVTNVFIRPRQDGQSGPKLTIGTGVDPDVNASGRCNVISNGSLEDLVAVGGADVEIKATDDAATNSIRLAGPTRCRFKGPTIDGNVTIYDGLFTLEDSTRATITLGGNLNIYSTGLADLANDVEAATVSGTITAYGGRLHVDSGRTITPSG